MEENPVPEVPVPEEPQPKRFFGFGAENTKWILLFLLILLSLAGGLFLNLRGNSTNKPPQKTEDDTTKKSEFIAPNSIVYGYWTKGNSTIAVLDLSTNLNTIIAELPLNIKHVKILDPKKIIYIKDTDESDYGKEIVARNLETKAETTIVKADSSFGIDDYVVSPNARYLAVWEVSPPAGSTQLFGGKSRVYTVDTQNPLQKNLIYDETSGLGITLAYPIAITDSGALFIDRFLPNSGAGWGYGVSVSDFSGANKQDIASLANGTISTQPTVSNDGKKLLFAGYDGRKGSGTIEIDGFRRAMLIPNTLEILDLSTRQKRTLFLAQGDDIFPNVKWDLLTGNIIYSLLSKDNSKSGNYVYDLAENISQKINLDKNLLTSPGQENATVKNVIAAISSDSFLVFDEIVSNSALGNLGSKYGQSINSAYIYNTTTQAKKTIILGTGGLTQFVDLKPEKYFSSLIASALGSSDRNKNQLQLQSFEIKPSLAPKRLAQQSDPPRERQCGLPESQKEAGVLCNFQCENLATQQCNNLLGPISTEDSQQNNDHAVAWNLCWAQALKDIKSSANCQDSPLYLYGQEGKSVSIYSSTPIYPLDINYSPTTGLKVILNGDGTFTSENERVSSFKFDYEPAIKIKKPKTGYIITRENLSGLVEKISNQLGLNEKEKVDTLNSLKEKVSSTHAFVSLFDDETSKKILPLVINPTPDTYRNTVFYIENLDENPSVSYLPPVIEKIQRKGFTAIEISFVVK